MCNGRRAILVIFVKMKKMLTICIAVLYTLITSGFTVNLHYCMGELASVNLHESHEDGCPKCGMDVKGDCCHDEAKLLKVSENHFGSSFATTGIVHSFALPVSLQPDWLQPLAERQVLHAGAPLHAPPLIPSNPLYTTYCTYLI